LKKILSNFSFLKIILFSFFKIGWSIGNVLLDATGGTMDIVQMILQAKNTGLFMKKIFFNFLFS